MLIIYKHKLKNKNKTLYKHKLKNHYFKQQPLVLSYIFSYKYQTKYINVKVRHSFKLLSHSTVLQKKKKLRNYPFTYSLEKTTYCFQLIKTNFIITILVKINITIEFFCFLVGYTMRDIRYKWGDGEKSIGMSTDVELPQFKVLGHRQDQKEEHLSTG